MNSIIGTGSFIPANIDENAENTLAKKPQIPNEVVLKRTGNSGACATYIRLNENDIPILQKKIRNTKNHDS